MKKKAIALNCSSGGPRKHNAHIVSTVSLHASMVEDRANASSNCSKDTNNASLQEDVQGSSYVPSSDGDENIEASKNDVEIPHGSSTNKSLNIPSPTEGPPIPNVAKVR